VFAAKGGEQFHAGTGSERTPVRTLAEGGSKGVDRKSKPQSPANFDQAVLALMRASPGASLSEIIRLGRRPPNTTVSSLKPLEANGLVEHPERGEWIAVGVDSGAVDKDLEASSQKPSAWIEPLSGKHVARHSAAGRVRDEISSLATA
jgi:hypothetical protein